MPQEYSQKYTVVCFFEPQDKSSNFSALDWPLHVTILDTFKTEWQKGALCEALDGVASEIAPFDTFPTQNSMLGEYKDVPVKILQLPGAMSSLHNKLMKLVDDGAFVFNTPEFVGEGFLPHATDQHDSKLNVGQTYRLDSFSLVDMFPGDDHMRREVIDTFRFKL